MAKDTEQPNVHVIEPNVRVYSDRNTGKQQKVTDVVVSFERDLTLYYGTEEKGEYVATLPVKITFKREV